MMIPKLVSFKLCPYVHRVAIVLQYKAIEHELVYIDLANPPVWFLELSPLKKVPILLLGDQVIFESAVINEYLDEAYPNKLHPVDLLLRAQNRSWIEFAGVCMLDAYYLSIKETENEYLEIRDQLLSKFDQLEKAIAGSPYFNGTDFSLVDATYAALFRRLVLINYLRPDIFNIARHPKINAWKDTLLKVQAVQQSCVPDLDDLYYEQLWMRKGYLAQRLDQTKYDPTVVKSIY